MPVFSYRAVGRDGKSLGGTIEAEGPEFATRQLRSQGLTLLSLEAGERAGATAIPGQGAGRAGKPGRQEVLAMTSELSVLLRAGLPLDRALKVLIDMAAQPGLDALLNDLLSAVKGGKPLSQALQAHEKVFGPFYISMVRAGEASGQLSAVLDRLVEHLENAKKNRDTVVSALIYPAILAVVALLSIVFMLTFVVPQFETLFDDMGDALPTMTRWVIAGADFIKAYGVVMLLAIGALVFYLRRWAAGAEGRKALHGRLLSLPLVGNLVFEFQMAKFSRTVGTLLDNGVSLLRALSIAMDTVDNVVLKEALSILPTAARSGKRLSRALEDSDMFTPMVIQMVRVGEESGRLDQMMMELADVFDGHVQSGVKRALALLEPVLILGMGVVIATIIIALLAGIMSVNDLAV